MKLSNLKPGERFRVAYPASWGPGPAGKLLSLSPSSASVEFDSNGRSFTAHDADGEPVAVAIANGKRRVQVSLTSEVERVA